MGDNMNPLNYFEDFLSIPRGSGNEKQISDYLVEFAKKNKLEYYQDKYNNVIIKRVGNNGSNDTIILQGHIDMVCTSNNDYDFINNSIDWYIEDNMYKAKCTTLGADNGIGCSIILAILSNKDISVPNIEAVFTVEEETTMLGAKKLDYSKITGNKLISIDGTEEGVIEVSSAGMVSMSVQEQLEYVDNINNTYEIKVSGLLGGHSGVDINKHRGNAIKIIGNILSKIDNVCINTINGGSKDNVIPDECSCIISTDNMIDVHNFMFKEYPTLKTDVKMIEKCAKVINREQSKKIIEFMHTLPIEVLTFIESYPQTSLNLAKIYINNDVMNIDISIRSSNKEDEFAKVNMVKELAHDMTFVLRDNIPFFTFKKDSKLRNILVSKYKELYNKDVVLEHVHAGLEGGVFSEYISDIDICVVAPNLYDIHTIKERVEIDSVNRVYSWLVKTLEEL